MFLSIAKLALVHHYQTLPHTEIDRIILGLEESTVDAR